MPFLIKVIFPEWACITVCLMFSFVVDILEEVRARFTFLGFESEGISFKASLITPCHFSVILHLIRAIILDTPRSMSSTCKNHVFPFPTILTLRNTWVYTNSSNCYDIISNMKH